PAPAVPSAPPGATSSTSSRRNQRPAAGPRQPAARVFSYFPYRLNPNDSMPIEEISINKFDLSFYQDEWKTCPPGNANEMKMAAELVEEKENARLPPTCENGGL
ncbi:hypothetical protein COI42_27900, partial [Priestia aryabhattai]